ncbi:MAG: TolC family protein [Lutibacter sp.]|uniref:TolC family protein n=1 Tax=Lutibacter sp. TaxID=1925666 RepID=UPI00184BDFAD|nr:TolC family protein [Lutibacter sp.]MBT8316733.1 TolC family protein [Lutibacter sp.]NNJ57593.1 TolC family protein [Lutibacter sp.]
MRKLLILFSGILLSLNAEAQEKISLSLDQAIDYALINSYAAINANRDIDAAKKKKWETTTIGLPQISATVDYQNWIKQQVSLIPAEFFGGNEGEFAEVEFGTKHSLNATATLRQLIFDGSYLVGLQSAKTYLKISENAKEKTELGIREAVINAYGNVLLSEESILILENNILSLEKTLNETSQMYVNGFIEEESVEQLQITLASIKSQLSKSQQLNNIAYKMLNITLGIDINRPIMLTDDLNSLSMKNIDLGVLSSNLSVENHVDFKIAKNTEKSNELLMKLEQSKALPSLSSFANFGYIGFGQNFEFLNKEQQWFDSSLLGISLEIPLFSSLARSSRTQQAKIELEKAKTKLTETEQTLMLQFETAKTEYNYSIEEYETSKQNLALAERIEKKQQIKFREGISTSFELSEAQRQLYTMQQNYLQAMLAIITNKAALDNALNTPIYN